MAAGRRRGATRVGATCLCACALAGCLPPALADSAAAPDAEAQATLDRSVRFLQEAQNADGGFGGKIGAASDPLFTAWAAYALAAAGINPQDQAKPGGDDVLSYLTAHTGGLKQTTDFDRVALVALASGTSPYSFGAVRPVEQILARQLPDGSFPQVVGGPSGWINSTAWSIFPLSAIETPAAEEAVREAAEWLLDQQQDGGGWGSTTAVSPADSDLTGAVIEALNAAGFHDTEEQEEAFEYLHTVQGPDGGFREQKNSATNSATTAWVLQGMWSAGVNPREWRVGTGPDPLQFLASLQQSDGSIKWTASDDLNSLWMTAQVAPALAGMTYPLPAVPRQERPPERPPPQQPRAESHRHSSSHGGHGGTGVVHADGVIAGGGGRGAPLFSGPQPQSGGATPHGSRQLDASAESSATPSGSTAAGGTSPGSTGAAGDGADANIAREPATTGTASAGTVEGRLVSARTGRGGAAPGLFAADSGGRTKTWIALVLAAGLLAAAAVGARRERAGTGAA